VSDVTDRNGRRDADVAAYLAPLVANAALEVEALGAGRVTLSQAARAGLADGLAQRLAMAIAPVVHAMVGKRTLRTAHELGADMHAAAAGWGAIFAAHADLVPLVERMIGEWRDGVALLLRRFADDAALLGETRAAIERVVVVDGAWKKSPTLRLTTGDGRDWFYKNHTLAIGAWLMEFVGRLNDVGGLLPLHVRTIEACPGYGWDTAVVARPCRDDGEAERYYVRIGMWLRLMQLLGANDLHAKNLIAVGEHPVPIDHENLLQPPRADATSALGIARRARQRSPLESGLLPHLLVGEPGRPALNAGGLEAGGDYLLPFKTPNGYPAIRLPCTLPRVAAGSHERGRLVSTSHERGRLVSADEGRDAILAGFAAMHGLLAGAGARVLDELLPRAAMFEVRVLRRPAHVTRRLIVESLQPEVLAQPGARAAMLAAKAHPADLQALIGSEVPRQYELPALDFVVRARSDVDHARDRDVIATAITCGTPPSMRTGAISATELAPPIAGESNTLVRAAVAIGDQILAEAHGDREALHWLGVAWHPLADARVIEVLPNDLLSGNAGLAVVFASLFKVTREARFADAARRALSPVARALAATNTPPTWRPWGAYVGSAGQLYAVQRVAGLLGGAASQPGAAQVGRLLQSASGGIDLATGTAGLVAVAAQVMTPTPAWLGALGDVLKNALRQGLPPLPYPHALMPTYLPDPLSSVLFALRRLATKPGMQRFGLEGPDAAASGGREPRAWDVGEGEMLLRRHAESGAWLLEGGLADRLNIGGMLGIGAVALALLRAAAPTARTPSLWQLD